MDPDTSPALTDRGYDSWPTVHEVLAVRPAIQLTNLQRAETFIFWLRSGDGLSTNHACVLTSEGALLGRYVNEFQFRAVRPAIQLTNLQRAETFIFLAAFRR